jgi:hypothetical protein
MMREKAWNTAISSVQGERRSSSSRARPCSVQLGALGLQDLLGAVALGFGVGVDAADSLRWGSAAVQRVGQVGGRIGGGQVHRQAAPGQLHGHGRRQGGLADPALAHQHHQAVAVGGDAVHQRRQAGAMHHRHRQRPGAAAAAAGTSVEQLAQGVQPDQVEGLEGNVVAGQRCEHLGHGRQGGLLAGMQGRGQRVEGGLARRATPR